MIRRGTPVWIIIQTIRIGRLPSGQAGAQIMTGKEKSKKIDDPQRDWVNTVLEVITLIAMAIVVFIGGMYLLVRVIGRFIPFWFSGLAGPLLVLGFDVLWCVGMRWWRPGGNQLKVLKKIVFVTVLALSTAVLTCWCIGYPFRQVW